MLHSAPSTVPPLDCCRIIAFMSTFFLALHLSFLTIVEEVPLCKWPSYMRVLGLTDNEIESAKMDNSGNVFEQNIKMLHKWLGKNGKKASLDILLQTLCDPPVNLKGVEQKIRQTLISREMYIYEE